jgi:hypothetical protein
MSEVVLVAAAVLISDHILAAPLVPIMVPLVLVPMVTTVGMDVMDVMGHEDITAGLLDPHPHHLSARLHSLPIFEA